MYSSCEKFRSAGLTEETWFSSAYWSDLNSNTNLDTLRMKLHAGYTDGHVESYCPSEVVLKTAQTGGELPKDLQKIIASWEDLPDHVRATIVMLIDSTRK